MGFMEIQDFFINKLTEALLAINLYSLKSALPKGHALAKKAGARTDFSYVSGHLGKF